MINKILHRTAYAMGVIVNNPRHDGELKYFVDIDFKDMDLTWSKSTFFFSNGYGVMIDTKENTEKLIKVVEGTIKEILGFDND